MMECTKGVLYQFYMLLRTIKPLKKIEENEANYSESEKYEVIQKFATKTLEVIGTNITVYGRANIPKENSLFIGNHKSITDGHIMVSVLNKPVGMIIADEGKFKNIPIAKNWLDLNGCLFIDRENNRNALRTIIKASDILKNRRSIGAFPEGKIMPRGCELGEFKEGLFKIAIKANAPVVPLVIVNNENSYKKRKYFLPKISKNNVEVHILEPIYTHIENPKISTRDLSNEVRNKMIEALNKNKELSNN